MTFNNFSGGKSASLMTGIKGSFAEMVGLDIHSEPGLLKVHQKMAKESGATVTALCKNIVSASDGNSYWFSSTDGKIWKRTSAGVWSLAHTNTIGACLGAYEYNGYIYYASATKLGRQSVTNASGEASWASENDSWQDFDNDDAIWHPMVEVNNNLYIGDGNQVAQLESDDTWTTDKLTLPSQFRVSALYPYGVDLLIGTYVGTASTIKVNYCKLFRWDTVSTSWNSSDSVYEAGINAFIPADNEVYIQAGLYGQIYYYNGSILIPFKRIPGTYSPTQYNTVYNQAVNYFKGISLIGVSNSPDAANSTGNPCGCGIYSLGRNSKNYPIVLDLSYPVYVAGTTADLDSVEIGCIAVIGNDLLVSWKKASAFGIDKLDTSNKITYAYLETLVVNQGLFNKNIVDMFAGYKTKPASTALAFSSKSNFASSYTAATELTETENQLVKTLENIYKIRAFQMKVAFTVNSNDAMEIDELGFNFK